MEVTVSGVRYTIGKLNAFDQLDVMAWLTPLAGGLLSGASEEGENKDAAAFAGLSSAIATMPRDTRRLCFVTLLAGVTKHVAEGMPAFPIVEAGVLKDTSLSGPAILELSARVFWFNLADFIDALPSDWQDNLRKLKDRLPG